MKTIIAGSRNIESYDVLLHVVALANFNITEVVSGNARGVDLLGERYAKENNIPLKLFPADWNTHGKKAGFIRNCEMAEYAHCLIAVWDGVSNGTRHMISEALKKKTMQVYVWRTDIHEAYFYPENKLVNLFV